jgi:hypothetical protein
MWQLKQSALHLKVDTAAAAASANCSVIRARCCAVLQGDAAKLIFSGAHPGAAPRHVSEANAMLAYAQTLIHHSVPTDL